MSARGAATRIAAVVLAAVVGATVVGCSDSGGEVVWSTTTAAPAEPGSEAAPTVPPVPLEDFRAALTAAVAGRDLCELLDVVELSRPDVADPSVVVPAYEALAAAVEDAAAFVPSELATAWDEVVDANRDAVDLARRGGGEIGDLALRARFETSVFNDAYVTVTGWADLNCGTDGR